jgi:molecular chaperone GrpE
MSEASNRRPEPPRAHTDERAAARAVDEDVEIRGAADGDGDGDGAASGPSPSGPGSGSVPGAAGGNGAEAASGKAPTLDDGGAVDVEGDIDELLALTAQRDEYLSLAQRTQADFENYRKRVAREAAQAQERGVVKLVKELLPALDNLDRAIAAAASEDPLLEGVRLVRHELAAGLTRTGVESFSPVGEAFDPSLHEAMATVEQPPGGAASGTVAEVYADGYRLGQTIIRPARVVVAA